MIKILSKFALFCTLFCTSVFATDVTGTLKAPNGQPVRNGTLSLSLSQAGVVAGDFALAATPVNCYTSTDGALVGLPNPAVAPAVTPNTASGTITSGTWYVRITYFTYDDMMMDIETESLPSAATSAVLVSTGRLIVTQPTLQPENADGYVVYIGTDPNATKLQAITPFGSNTTVSSYDSMGDAPPSTNDSVCSIQGNDTIIPTLTWYRVAVTNSAGAVVTGFPQNWYIQGSTINISNSLPLAAVTQQVRFPTPLLQNPSANAQQSVNSPVTLNGYSLTAGALILPDNDDPPTCTSGRVTIYSDSGSLVICEGASPISGISGNTYKSQIMTATIEDMSDVEQDLTGATVSLDRNGFWMVIGVFDAQADPMMDAMGAVFCGYLDVDGSDAAGKAVLGSSTINLRGTVTQTWIVEITSQPKTIKLRGQKCEGGDDAVINVRDTTTNLKAIWINE